MSEGANKRGKKRKAKGGWAWKGPRGKQVVSKSASLIWLGEIPRSLANEKHLHQVLRNHTPSGVLQPDLLRVYPKGYRDRETKEWVAFAFVVAATQQDADRLIAEWDGKELAPGFKARAKPGKCEDLEINPHEATWAENGLDPDVRSQLQPLHADEVAQRLQREQRGDDPKAEFDELVAYVTSNPRETKHAQGVEVPTELREKALQALSQTTWPGMSNRGSVNAENYLVLQVKDSQPVKECYQSLFEACMNILRWADASYPVSAMAITKNFLGSPHIDRRDKRFQYAMSLGDFEGGQLVVEDIDHKSLWVVDTRNKIGRVDGRCIHWVRKYSGGDRYSIIWYSSHEDTQLPLTFAVDTTFSAPQNLSSQQQQSEQQPDENKQD